MLSLLNYRTSNWDPNQHWETTTIDSPYSPPPNLIFNLYTAGFSAVTLPLKAEKLQKEQSLCIISIAKGRDNSLQLFNASLD
jgi:hypothetical protein